MTIASKDSNPAHCCLQPEARTSRLLTWKDYSSATERCEARCQCQRHSPRLTECQYSRYLNGRRPPSRSLAYLWSFVELKHPWISKSCAGAPPLPLFVLKLIKHGDNADTTTEKVKLRDHRSIPVEQLHGLGEQRELVRRYASAKPNHGLHCAGAIRMRAYSMSSLHVSQ